MLVTLATEGLLLTRVRGASEPSLAEAGCGPPMITMQVWEVLLEPDGSSSEEPHTTTVRVCRDRAAATLLAVSAGGELAFSETDSAETRWEFDADAAGRYAVRHATSGLFLAAGAGGRLELRETPQHFRVTPV